MIINLLSLNIDSAISDHIWQNTIYNYSIIVLLDNEQKKHNTSNKFKTCYCKHISGTNLKTISTALELFEHINNPSSLSDVTELKTKSGDRRVHFLVPYMYIRRKIYTSLYVIRCHEFSIVINVGATFAYPQ